MAQSEENQDLVSQTGSIPEANRADTSGQSRRVAAQFEHIYESYEGDLPPPEHMAELEALMPGATNRLFIIAEKEQEQRHKLEWAEIEAEREDQKQVGKAIDNKDAVNQRDSRHSILSLLAATVVVLVTLGVYAYSLATNKHSDASFALLVGELAGLAGAFIYSANKKQAEKAARQTGKDEPDADESQIEDAE